MKKVVIVGGGFAGIEVARVLQKHADRFTTTLVSKVHHFEYTPALYRVVTGESPLEVCIPLTEIFSDDRVIVEVDEIVSVDQAQKKVIGASGSHYEYDYLVLALGSETVFFNTAGMSEHSYGFKSINEALRLKRHLHKEFEEAKTCSDLDQLPHMHIVIIGGGASGTELAGELADYTRKFGIKHDVDINKIKITLIEGGPRLLAALPEKLATQALDSLKKKGIEILLNTRVLKADEEKVYLQDHEIETNTIIWTAGVKPNKLYSNIGAPVAKNGRVEVDEILRLKSAPEIFVVGDGAATTYSGMAQTAIYDGKFVGNNIARLDYGDIPIKYNPSKPSYSVPAGPGWAVFSGFGLAFSGYLGFIMRKIIDLHYFFSILPLDKAITVWIDGKKLCETCPTCTKEKF